MTRAAGFFACLGICLCVFLTGCFPSGRVEDEERDPHFVAGKSRVSEMDFRGAIDCFEKALETNPNSAAAHFELGWLYDQKEGEPAAAIYHYERYLRLRPGVGNSDTVKAHIVACKQELARTVSLGPVTQTLQREYERAQEENKSLREQIEQLRAQLALARPPAGSSPASASSLAPSASSPGSSSGNSAGNASAESRKNSRDLVQVSTAKAPASNRNNSSASSVLRQHKVQTGETPSSIARHYGIKVEALMAANPQVDARRMRTGQVLNIPSQ